jgi:hypothetical protein
MNCGSNRKLGLYFNDSCLRDSVHTIKNQPLINKYGNCIGFISEAEYKPLVGIYVTFVIWKRFVVTDTIDEILKIDISYIGGIETFCGCIVVDKFTLSGVVLKLVDDERIG